MTLFLPIQSVPIRSLVSLLHPSSKMGLYFGLLIKLRTFNLTFLGGYNLSVYFFCRFSGFVINDESTQPTLIEIQQRIYHSFLQKSVVNFKLKKKLFFG